MSEDNRIVSQGTSNFVAYRVEYKNEDKVWKTVHYDRTKDGVPYPICDAGFLSDHEFLGFEQAMALAWRLSADKSANFGRDLMGGRSKMIYGVRIVPHDIHLEYSATKKEGEAEELEHSFAGIRIERKKKVVDDEQA